MDPYRYGDGLTRQGSGLWRSFRDGDFEEEDVWGVLRERKDSSSNFENSTQSSSFSVPRKIPTPAAAARMVPRMSSSNYSSNYSSSSNSPHEHNKVVVVQQSAPVNIPDWSKISGKNSKINASKNINSWLDHDRDQDCDVDGGGGGGLYDDDDDDDDDDNEYNDKIPPHEFIARRLASSQISSFSVFEGAGRTLKGRDLSKVRNAVLTKTGFLESL